MITGCSVLFTGLPGAGKSTIALALQRALQRSGSPDVELLDGDVLRNLWQPPLGFSKSDRDLQVERVAHLAREVVIRGGCAVCALIAPYDEARRRARHVLESAGAFLLVYVATPIDVCEQRDPRGLYTKARQGLIPSFTGVSDPYEVPVDADVTIDTTALSADDAAMMICARLEDLRSSEPR